jgi:hypothetical protein
MYDVGGTGPLPSLSGTGTAAGVSGMVTGYGEDDQRYTSGAGPASYGEAPPGAPSPGQRWREELAAAADLDQGAYDKGAYDKSAHDKPASDRRDFDKVSPSETGRHRPRPGRMVLGLASLAAERLRGGAPHSAALVTGVGLVQESAAGARDLARRMLEPAARLAADAADRANLLPGADRPLRTLERSRSRLAAMMARARRRGEATVAAGRADAQAFVKSSVADTLSWAQARAVPQLVDGLVPHLVDEVVPKILEGTLPEIRARVLPAVIDDLANSPQVRELVLEQGRGVVDEAAVNLRSTTASADDRVESAFRRLIRSPEPEPPKEEPGSNGG